MAPGWSLTCHSLVLKCNCLVIRGEKLCLKLFQSGQSYNGSIFFKAEKFFSALEEIQTKKDEINFFFKYTIFRSCILFCWKVHSSLQLALAVNLQIFVQKLDKKWWWLPPLKVEMSLINAFFSLPAWTVIAPPLTFLSKCNCVLIQQIHANFFYYFWSLPSINNPSKLRQHYWKTLKM